MPFNVLKLLFEVCRPSAGQVQAKCRLAGGAPDGRAPEGGTPDDGAPAGGVLGVVSEVDKYVPSLGGPNAVLKVSISSPILPDVVEADMILVHKEEREG